MIAVPPFFAEYQAIVDAELAGFDVLTPKASFSVPAFTPAPRISSIHANCAKIRKCA